MEYDKPSKKGFTIYTKSGCPGCIKVKTLLQERNPIIIDCDEYLFDDRPRFKEFVNKMASKEIKQFPIVFYDGAYIGAYQETYDLYNKIGIDIDELFQYE
jgi:glutaredoxin